MQLAVHPCHWASTRCSREHLLGHTHPSGESLTGNTVLQAVREKCPNPKLLSGEDTLLD